MIGARHPGQADRASRSRDRRGDCGVDRTAQARSDRSEPESRRGRRRRRAGACRSATRCFPSSRRVAALVDHRQRGRGPRRAARRRQIRRRLPDHARDRDPRMDGGGAAAMRRRADAGRGRTGLDQHDHRRQLWRRAVADRDRWSRPVADDRIARPRRRLGNPAGGRQRDAIGSFDRHRHQVGAERPQHRGLRAARRRAACGDRAAVDFRLPIDRAMVGASGRNAADPRHHAVRSVAGPDPRRDRSAGGRRLPIQAAGG